MFSVSSLALSYSISTNPNPIQVSSDNSPRTADIDIVFNNNSSSSISLEELNIKIPVGDNAQELTADATSISYQVIPNGTPQSPIWDISSNAGTVSLTSHNGNPVLITTTGFTIQLFNIEVNKAVGMCYLSLTETTVTTDQDKKINNGKLQCSKFPATFSLNNFVARDSTRKVVSLINPDTSIWLTWEANVVPNSTLSLSCGQLDIDVTKYHAPDSNQYRYPSSDTRGILINNDDKTFKLQANYNMPDGTVLQSVYQYTVLVVQPAKIETFTVIPQRKNGDGKIWFGETVTITWTTNDATAYCQLFRNEDQVKEPSEGEFSKHDVTYIDSPSCTASYKLLAYNNAKLEKDSRQDTTIKVYQWQTLPSISRSFPSDIAITSDGKWGCLTRTDSKLVNHFAVIDIAKNSIISEVNLWFTGDYVSTGFAPGVAIVPSKMNETEAYVINTSSRRQGGIGGNFSILEIASCKLLSTFEASEVVIEQRPSHIDVVSENNIFYAYITNYGAKNIVKLPLNTQAVVPVVWPKVFSVSFYPLVTAVTSQGFCVTSHDSVIHFYKKNTDFLNPVKSISLLKSDNRYGMKYITEIVSDNNFIYVLGVNMLPKGNFSPYVTFVDIKRYTERYSILLEKNSLTSTDLSVLLGGMTITDDKKKIYVTSTSAPNKDYKKKPILPSDYQGKIYEIDIANKTSSLLMNLPKSQRPMGIAVAKDKTHLYVTCVNITNLIESTVYKIDISSKKILNHISLTGLIPINIKVTPDWEKLCILNINNNRFPSITLIDINMDKIPSLTPEPKPWDIAITSDGAYAYVTNAGANNVFRVDISQNKVLNTIPVGQFPSGIAITFRHKYAYVTNMGDNSVSVIEISTNKVVKTLTLEARSLPTGIAIAKRDNQEFVYITNTGINSVSVIDVAKNVVSSNSIQVGTSPIDIAITSDSQHAFVTNFASHDVTMIDTNTNAVIPTPIKVEQFPTSIAITPNGKSIYVTNAGSHSVSVLQKIKTLAPDDPKPAVIITLPQNRVRESHILDSEFESSTASKALLFNFKSKPTDKSVEKLQKWLVSIGAMGNWKVERIANTLLIQFQSTKQNKAQEEKLVNTLLLSLKKLPEWKDIEKAEQEGSHVLIHCYQDDIEKYEQILGDILGVHQPPQARLCAIS